MPIDTFLCSLAEDRKANAVGVILSGAATDGTLGLKAIKSEGGITFAQDESAKFDGMPRSAVARGGGRFRVAAGCNRQGTGRHRPASVPHRRHYLPACTRRRLLF